MRQNFDIFRPRHVAERNFLATPLLLAALWRLQPSGAAPQQIRELIRLGRTSDALSLAERLTVEGCDFP
jgi:hypothetical protein